MMEAEKAQKQKAIIEEEQKKYAEEIDKKYAQKISNEDLQAMRLARIARFTQ